MLLAGVAAGAVFAEVTLTVKAIPTCVHALYSSHQDCSFLDASVVHRGDRKHELKFNSTNKEVQIITSGESSKGEAIANPSTVILTMCVIVKNEK